MVKQRFLLLFRRWLVTVAMVLGPILLFEVFVSFLCRNVSETWNRQLE